MEFDKNGNIIPQKIKFNVEPDEFILDSYENPNTAESEVLHPRKIEIFDIDGCICDNFFPNLNENADISDLKQRILNTLINPNFVEHYRKSVALKYFITGRRFKDFGFETLEQLKNLHINPGQIVFYPDTYNHTKIRYNTFKIYNILKIAVQHKHSEIVVYDDIISYYPKLISLGLALKIEKLRTIHVKNHKKFWSGL